MLLAVIIVNHQSLQLTVATQLLHATNKASRVQANPLKLNHKQIATRLVGDANN
jgi:hypothetical protein